MKQTQHETINYLTYDQSLDLVERIAERATNFDYIMTVPEEQAMAQLLSDIGVKTSDLIDVSNLADNYAINAEIVRPEDYEHYNMKSLREDSLFQWKEDGENCYCLSW